MHFRSSRLGYEPPDHAIDRITVILALPLIVP